VAASAWLLVVVVLHARREVYDLPAGAIAVGVLAAVFAIGGWATIAVARDGVLLLGVVCALLLVAGVVSILSIGVLLLLAGVALATLTGRLAQGRPRIDVATLARAVVGAGLAFPIAALVAADGPVVECRADGGVSTRSSIFRGGSTVSAGQASSSTARDQTSEGTMTNGNRTYTYRCSDGRLVEFVVRSGS
jgi:hypothetical protein